MGSTFGTSLRVTIFGQSHSDAIGCVIEGLPAGFALDTDALDAFMQRRAPGRNAWSTPRFEADKPHIICGLNPDGQTCGVPLTAIIENTNTRPNDYAELRRIPRPGHADFTAQAKWHGVQDVSGGGHFSARLTAPLCVAGGIALQFLESQGVRIAAHVAQIADERDVPFDGLRNTPSAQEHLVSQMRALREHEPSDFPTINAKAGERMKNVIQKAREEGDSVGGIVECVACGMPAGIGGPRYDGIQSAVARVAFGIPAIKGLEFGAGFDVAQMRGSANNDAYQMLGETPVPISNHAGGSLGGITTGAPVLFRLAVKPTPSIAQAQRSIDFASHSQATLSVRGRHDPCVAPRAVPIAEAAMAIALLDSWLSFPPTHDWSFHAGAL